MRPLERFMAQGGPLGLGRSRNRPWKGTRTRRVFRTCIHIRRDEHGFNYFRNSANVHAFNSHWLVPVFAYEFRQEPQTPPPPPRPGEELAEVEPEIEWRMAA